MKQSWASLHMVMPTCAYTYANGDVTTREKKALSSLLLFAELSRSEHNQIKRSMRRKISEANEDLRLSFHHNHSPLQRLRMRKRGLLSHRGEKRIPKSFVSCTRREEKKISASKKERRRQEKKVSIGDDSTEASLVLPKEATKYIKWLRQAGREGGKK